jgi:hypothetical protein
MISTWDDHIFTKKHWRLTMNAKQELEALRAENAKLKADKEKANVIRFKVGEKGGLSMYGLGRFPVTLYLEQWKRLIDAVPLIEQALEDNAKSLKTKE